MTVRTSQFSPWNVGKLAYSLSAGLAPVNLPPVVNTTKAGSAIPVSASDQELTPPLTKSPLRL